jgi:hypothetical protein
VACKLAKPSSPPADADDSDRAHDDDGSAKPVRAGNPAEPPAVNEGRHRITAMRDTGVRRTVTVRLELAGTGEKT